MGVTLADILSCLDEIAPFAMAEPWDNVGLIVGNRGREVNSILVGLDPTNRLLEEAIDKGIDTVITHHPAIFKPLPSIDTADVGGRFLETSLSRRLNVIACHTNFDAVANGVNDVFAERLELSDVEPLVPAGEGAMAGAGMGRVGYFKKAREKRDFVDCLLDVLNLPYVQMAGELPETISTVALCGGSGSEFAEIAYRRGADVYISAEIKHNVACWAEECGFCIIDGTHYATEKPAVKLLAERLKTYCAKHNWNIEIVETETEFHPFKAVNKNSY